MHVEQGHMHNAKVVLRGEAGCSDPSMLPGDVVFVLEAKPHAVFKRVHHDLIMEKVRGQDQNSPCLQGLLPAQQVEAM